MKKNNIVLWLFLVILFVITCFNSITLVSLRKQITFTSPSAENTLPTTTQFSFTIPNMVTNHQFPGQVNSFFIDYQYRTDLKNPGYDPTGHIVDNNQYPYFQTVRSDIIQYIQNYPNKNDFYETFAQNIANYVIQKYPQIAWIQLKVDAPAYAGVALPREVVVTQHHSNELSGK